MPRGKANSKEPEDFKSKFRRSKDKKEPIKESKKKSKKDSKKKSKKLSDNELKLKPYCGIKTVPKNKRRGTMDECYSRGEIRYFGLNKIDSKVIENKKKKDILASLELNQTMLTLKARKNLIQIKSLKRKLENMTTDIEINKANLKIEALKEENKIIKEKLDKIKKK
jgi:hypothetical protein